MSSVVAVVPARYASTRFPGKPLADLAGRPMIQWVVEAALKTISKVVVATDDRRILDAVQAFGGKAMMTPASCESGTERMAAVAKKVRADFYVNIQGDEPLIQKESVRAALKLAVSKKAIATSATDLDLDDFHNPNVVKVAADKENRALYFSRAPIPYPRDGILHEKPLKHLGLYVYPRAQLLKFVTLRPTALEKTEMLEQLRALYYGMPMYVAKTKFDSVGVDTPADLEAVAVRLRGENPH